MKLYPQSDHWDTKSIRQQAFQQSRRQEGGLETSEEWRVRGPVPAEQAGTIKAKLLLKRWANRGSDITGGVNAEQGGDGDDGGDGQQGRSQQGGKWSGKGASKPSKRKGKGGKDDEEEDENYIDDDGRRALDVMTLNPTTKRMLAKIQKKQEDDAKTWHSYVWQAFILGVDAGRQLHPRRIVQNVRGGVRWVRDTRKSYQEKMKKREQQRRKREQIKELKDQKAMSQMQMNQNQMNLNKLKKLGPGTAADKYISPEDAPKDHVINFRNMGGQGGGPGDDLGYESDESSTVGKPKQYKTYRLKRTVEYKLPLMQRILNLTVGRNFSIFGGSTANKLRQNRVSFFDDDYKGFDYSNLDLTGKAWWIEWISYLGPMTLFLINLVYYRVGEICYALTWSRHTPFQSRQLFVLVCQFIASIQAYAFILKTLEGYYDITNFFFITMITYILPFAYAFYSLMVYLPCPTVASLVCNSTLAGLLVTIAVVTWSGAKNIWICLTSVAAVWPIICSMSMLARIFVGQKDRQFHPLKHIPPLSVLSAAQIYFLILSLKKLTLTDFFVALCIFDPCLSCILTPIMERTRLQLYFNRMKILVGIAIMFYLYVDSRATLPEGSDSTGSSSGARVLDQDGLFLLLLSRSVTFIRALIVKRVNMIFFDAEGVDCPTASEAGIFFFNRSVRPHKYLYGDKDYPSPVKLRLDIAFDSGICDDCYHSIGTSGTKDLFLLTEWIFNLPLLAVGTMMHESDSLHFGFLPPILGPVGGNGNASAILLTANIRDDDLWTIMKSIILVIVLIIARFIEPQVISWTLFDRGSSPSDWVGRPLRFKVPLLIMSHLYLESGLDNPQILYAALILGFFYQFRLQLYGRWLRRYLLLTTQELQYYQPNCFKTLHRQCMLEFLNRGSLEAYQNLLLEVASAHGRNIRDPHQDLTLTHRKAKPTATAAWKMSIGLASTLAATQKRIRQQKIEQRKKMQVFFQDIVYECSDRAIDFLRSLETANQRATTHFVPVAKKWAFRRLRAFVMSRKMAEAKRVNGERALSMSDIKSELYDGKASIAPSFVERGRVYVFGSNAFGQLGLCLRKTDVLETHTPKCVYAVDGDRIRQLVATPRSSLFVMDKSIFVCGSNRVSELGYDCQMKVEITIPSCLKSIRSREIGMASSYGGSGQHQTIILMNDGKCYGSGQSTCGALTNFDECVRHQRSMIDPDASLGPVNLRLKFLVRRVACGAKHSLFVEATSGQVYSCGDNRNGQLGLGALDSGLGSTDGHLSLQQSHANSPKRNHDKDSKDHKSDKDKDSDFKMPGTNPMPQFVLKPRSKIKTLDEPTPIPGLQKVYLLECGPNFSYAATMEKGLFAWGANSAGQCGINSVVDVFQPQNCIFHEPKLSKVEMLSNKTLDQVGDLEYEKERKEQEIRDRKARILAAKEEEKQKLLRRTTVIPGGGETLAVPVINPGGLSNATGAGGAGKIASKNIRSKSHSNNRTDSKNNENSEKSMLEFHINRVFTVDESTIAVRDKQHFYSTIACGEQHCLISDFSMIYSWGTGLNLNRQLGITDSDFSKAKDVYLAFHPITPKLNKKVRVKQFACAGQHSLALDRDGGLWVFGDNSYSQLGFPSATHPKIEVPTLLPSTSDFKVRQVSTGLSHTMILL